MHRYSSDPRMSLMGNSGGVPPGPVRAGPTGVALVISDGPKVFPSCPNWAMTVRCTWTNPPGISGVRVLVYENGALIQTSDQPSSAVAFSKGDDTLGEPVQGSMSWRFEIASKYADGSMSDFVSSPEVVGNSPC